MPRQILGQLVEHLAENLEEPCLGIDKDGKLHLANPAAIRLLGLGAGFKGKKFWDACQVPELTRLLSRALKEPGKDRRESLLVLPSKEAFVVQLSIVRGAEGRMAGVTALLREVSQLQQLEQDLTSTIDRISQELKRPLTSVKGYVETLLEGAYVDPTICRRFLQVINDETNRMTRLLVGMMDVAGASKQPVQHVLLDLVPVARECVERLAPLARQKGIDLRVEPLPARAEVWGNVEQLTQIITNLLDNALKYTGAQVGVSPGQVALAVREVPDGFDLEVRDDGLGIDASEQAAIFERFYRVSTGPAALVGGTGLGLAIARELARSMGGEVGVRSRLGEGSSFILKLSSLRPASAASPP